MIFWNCFLGKTMKFLWFLGQKFVIISYNNKSSAMCWLVLIISCICTLKTDHYIISRHRITVIRNVRCAIEEWACIILRKHPFNICTECYFHIFCIHCHYTTNMEKVVWFNTEKKVWTNSPNCNRPQSYVLEGEKKWCSHWHRPSL